MTIEIDKIKLLYYDRFKSITHDYGVKIGSWNDQVFYTLVCATSTLASWVSPFTSMKPEQFIPVHRYVNYMISYNYIFYL